MAASRRKTPAMMRTTHHSTSVYASLILIPLFTISLILIPLFTVSLSHITCIKDINSRALYGYSFRALKKKYNYSAANAYLDEMYMKQIENEQGCVSNPTIS